MDILDIHKDGIVIMGILDKDSTVIMDILIINKIAQSS
jgi:hypothetical protein